MDELSFLCPKCNLEYPKTVQTTRGTCRACGFVGRLAGSRKSCFIQRERQHNYYKNAQIRQRNSRCGILSPGQGEGT